jgi:prolyl-tRNA synthetase
MRYSKLFGGKTLQTPPKDAETANAKYLVQAGFIDQLAAGIYTFLPLGLKVLHKINHIIREELNEIGGQEILMPALHPIDIWKTTGRDQTCKDTLYWTKGHGDKDFVLGMSHEEVVTPLAKKFFNSYKDLPLAVYQIQNKFRNEPRAKSGILRGREFGMKDMYSFHASEEDLDLYYEEVKKAYLRIYERCGVEAYVVQASGGSFTDKYSHEFQVLSDAGEDKIHISKKHHVAFNSEIMKAGQTEYEGDKLVEAKGIEAGNIFKLGTKFSEDFGAYFVDQQDNKRPAVMGCYGIGNTRLVGTIVEASHDEKGIIWPKNVAPFQVHLISLGAKENLISSAGDLYNKLKMEGFEVLYDDRDERAGKKFNDADLIGIPVRLVISERTLEEGQVEWKERSSADAKMVKITSLIDDLKLYYK